MNDNDSIDRVNRAKSRQAEIAGAGKLPKRVELVDKSEVLQRGGLLQFSRLCLLVGGVSVCLQRRCRAD